MGRIERVLVVDDHALQLFIMNRQLSRLGIPHILQASDAITALTIAKSSHFDLIICDLDMPNLDGFGFLNRLRAQGYKGAICIVTGFDQSISNLASDMCSQLGFVDVRTLQKPVLDSVWQHVVDSVNSHEVIVSSKLSLHHPTKKELIDSLKNKEFIPYLQPQVCFKTDCVCGYEALARWHHLIHGILTPNLFMPLIEEFQLTELLFYCVFEQCLDYLISHNGCMKISINATQACFEQDDFSNQVLSMIKKHGVDSSRITIELTETDIYRQTPIVLENFARLKIHGVGLSIDDFGTGHSSLLKLSNLPFTELKIDQVFTQSILSDDRSKSIINMIVSLARDFGLTTVAEGVEDEETWQYLYHLGIDICQGYYTGKPEHLKNNT